MPTVIVLGGGALGRWLGHKDGALMKKISAFITQTPESSLAPFSMWGHHEKTAICELGSGLSPETESDSPLILHLKPPKLWEISFCCSWAINPKYTYPVYGILSQKPKGLRVPTVPMQRHLLCSWNKMGGFSCCFFPYFPIYTHGFMCISF